MTRNSRKTNVPTVARLHFKDGTTQERPITNRGCSVGLTNCFIALVDENQNTTNYLVFVKTPKISIRWLPSMMRLTSLRLPNPMTFLIERQ